MEQRIKELEDMIQARDLEDRPILNEDAEFKEIYELVELGRFEEVEKRYKEMINKYYQGRLKTISKDYVDKTSYLTKW